MPSGEAAVSDVAKYIRQKCALPAGELEWFEGIAERRFVPRSGVFCGIGQACHELGFVHEGILQVYAVSAEGTQVVLDFVFPGAFALALRSAVAGAPSEVCFEAVAPCVLSVWPYGMRHAAAARHVEWERLEARMTEEMFARKQQRDLSLRTRSARERYGDMASELPDAGRSIPQRLLASYLCVTPQYLSRLRREERQQTSAARRRVAALRRIGD